MIDKRGLVVLLALAASCVSAGVFFFETARRSELSGRKIVVVEDKVASLDIHYARTAKRNPSLILGLENHPRAFSVDGIHRPYFDLEAFTERQPERVRLRVSQSDLEQASGPVEVFSLADEDHVYMDDVLYSQWRRRTQWLWTTIATVGVMGGLWIAIRGIRWYRR